MNRPERRKAAAKCKQHRNAQSPLQDKPVVIPADLRADIAASIRGIEFSVTADDSCTGGLCLYRTVIGLELLGLLCIPARLALGGMVYRVGPDPQRDVVAYCGEGNVGRLSEAGMLGHCWLESGDEVVDFSVGDWRATEPEDVSVLGPVNWTIEPPDFFWLPKASVAPIAGQMTPPLGRAYYTGWRGPSPVANIQEARVGIDWRTIGSYFTACCTHYALKSRVASIMN